MRPLGIFIVNDVDKYAFANPGACQMTGYRHEELLALSISQFLAPGSLNEGLKLFALSKGYKTHYKGDPIASYAPAEFVTFDKVWYYAYVAPVLRVQAFRVSEKDPLL